MYCHTRKTDQKKAKEKIENNCYFLNIITHLQN